MKAWPCHELLYMNVPYTATYVVLGELHDAADARDVNDTGRVLGVIAGALIEEAKERHCHEEYGERVDAVQARPAVKRFALEESAAECLWVFPLRRVGVFEP